MEKSKTITPAPEEIKAYIIAKLIDIIEFSLFVEDVVEKDAVKSSAKPLQRKHSKGSHQDEAKFAQIPLLPPEGVSGLALAPPEDNSPALAEQVCGPEKSFAATRPSKLATDCDTAYLEAQSPAVRTIQDKNQSQTEPACAKKRLRDAAVGLKALEMLIKQMGSANTPESIGENQPTVTIISGLDEEKL